MKKAAWVLSTAVALIMNGTAPAVAGAQESSMTSLTKVGSVIHGFRLVKVDKVQEADSTALLFEHVKSGARLLYLANPDEEKVFSITFKTIPQDDTGVAHILEHSVLNGSRKFPSKEPFVELMKGSVNTFLNAMTFPDKTMYPVASKNEKDFRNLMDVYLDAVFYPRLHNVPEILKQEGWHYEIDSKTKALSYNGVVYNEMKGVFSSPDSLLSRESYHSLYPDGTYGFESGGDPISIPKLTQDQFVAFHKKYYHPSNSLIYLYGNGKIEEDLKFLDEEYLAAFDRAPRPADIVVQKPFAKPRESQIEYSINADDSTKDKTYLSLNYSYGRATDSELSLAGEILEYILLETPASPLKRALLDAGIGKDVGGEWENGILQPMMSIVVKQSNPEQKKKFAETVNKTLEKLSREGISKKLVEAALNRKEFALREFEVRGYPKGLAYNMKILDSWLYDGDPLANVRFEPILAKIKKEAANGYFEKMIRTLLLENKHRSILVLTPKKGLDEKRGKELAKKLSVYKASLKKAAIAQIQTETEQLKKIQQTPDSPEVLAKIPLLTIKDLNREAEKLPRKEHHEGDATVLHHDLFTNHIGYVSLYFDTTGVPVEKIPYLSLLATVLAKMSTERHDYQDLANELNLNTGGTSYGPSSFANKDNANEFNPKFVVRSKALLPKLPKLVDLLTEVLNETKFSDKQRLHEIISEVKSHYQASITSSGSSYARVRALSYLSSSGKYDELLRGVSMYRFLADLDKNFDKKSDEIVKNLELVSKLVFRRGDLIVSFTADENDFKTARPELKRLIGAFSADKAPRQDYRFTLKKDNEGLVIPSKVQFVVQAADFRALGFKFTGALRVLENILQTDYLWNRVRVQGGAYGAHMDVQRNGIILLSSYRDPNLKETLEAFQKSVDWLKSFSPSEREMTKYIIGTIGGLDSTMTPSMKGERSDGEFLTKVTQGDIQKARDEVLDTKVGDVRDLAALIQKVIEAQTISVVGGDAKLKENQKLFGSLVPVFQ